jgi:hypothetical protein
MMEEGRRRMAMMICFDDLTVFLTLPIPAVLLLPAAEKAMHA